MNIITIEENVKQLIATLQSNELDQKSFIYELLLAYGHRPQSVGRVRSGERNLAEDKENSVFWKRQLYFKIGKSKNLYDLIDQMSHEKRTEANKIRFVIVTDFQKLLAIDTKTKDTLDIDFAELPKKFDFFLPWANIEKAVYQGENPADVKAAEKLAKLFDEIKADNFSEDELNNKENLHQLNIFLSRLLFCYFAEDTGIFKDKQFTSAISSTLEDGSDLASLVKRLFDVLNQSNTDRASDLPDFLSDFPYVNGGLFKDDIKVPTFTRKSRRILIECGAELDWSDINPDIFGSMFQAVVHTEQRSNMGQHYTSVPNIMKVIEPLFLNDLYEELEKNENSIPKLMELQLRLGKIKIFDPACGSGNFLIIAYKELRKFEMDVLKRIQELELEKTGQFSKSFSVFQVSQFYGIEIDDFACEVAILSLWLAEHQMNIVFKDEFGESPPSLPLRQGGSIICENSNLYSWEKLLDDCITNQVYILGNPPYRGYSVKPKIPQHSIEKDHVFHGVNSYKKLDYISCWFYKAAKYIKQSKCLCRCAFVTTSSIVQGEQVGMLWPKLYDLDIEICFAYTPFKWVNNARDVAGVSVVIIGIQGISKESKYLFTSIGIKSVDEINGYLTDAKQILITGQRKSISNLPTMVIGSKATDDGNLILEQDEVLKICQEYPQSKKFFKKYLGADDFLQGTYRYCLVIAEEEYDEANCNPYINERLERCKKFRLESTKLATRKKAEKPYLFDEFKYLPKSCIIVPQTTSENRRYIPIGIVDENTVVSNGLRLVYDLEIWLVSILSSRIHNVWIQTVAGRLETRIQYSNTICYNSFPLPKLSNNEKLQLSESALKILSTRELYSDLSLVNLYDSEKMPLDLKRAHIENDLLVEKIYKESGFKSDDERLEYLMYLYEKLVNKNE